MAQLKEKEAEIAILRDQLQRMSSHDPLTPQLTNGTSEKHKKTVQTPVYCTLYIHMNLIRNDIKMKKW